MSDNIDSGEDVVLLCLRSVDCTHTDMQQLQTVGINVYEFDDVDEYVQYLLSLNSEDIVVFVWLGFGWNHLIVILHNFENVDYIYLSEPTGEKCVPKVRGVFVNPTELFQQVLVDARACQLNQSTHLSVFENQETATIQNQQGNVIRSMWAEILLQGLLRMPTPTADVYREMLDEARYFYRNNSAQLAQIDDFENNYRANNAINWYSRDSFAYRLVNKALRTQNFAVILKFRFFIRDVYEQLKRLYHEQILARQTISGKCLLNTKVF
jgi:hypothetical protein